MNMQEQIKLTKRISDIEKLANALARDVDQLREQVGIFLLLQNENESQPQEVKKPHSRLKEGYSPNELDSIFKNVKRAPRRKKNSDDE